MLKDVGMRVPKIRQTSAICMQQDGVGGHVTIIIAEHISVRQLIQVRGVML